VQDALAMYVVERLGHLDVHVEQLKKIHFLPRPRSRFDEITE